MRCDHPQSVGHNNVLHPLLHRLLAPMILARGQMESKPLRVVGMLGKTSSSLSGEDELQREKGAVESRGDHDSDLALVVRARHRNIAASGGRIRASRGRDEVNACLVCVDDEIGVDLQQPQQQAERGQQTNC